ncbi:hypothetical protein Agabi119p4_5229 [Agaricus bisporus var. burnettii]|uniref:Uncharacterized protein n=1 Tax=Agaricus bisporus var. burnettii TaxID=192524 RepID=A0A8H7KI22_AGABI|nr:hypothetical protein Agabi119p4_5229 [Agaricus bisporus var. burnettii]
MAPTDKFATLSHDGRVSLSDAALTAKKPAGTTLSVLPLPPTTSSAFEENSPNSGRLFLDRVHSEGSLRLDSESAETFIIN